MLPLSPISNLPATLPLDGAIRIEVEEGVPIFRATDAVQTRIEELLSRAESSLSAEEEIELDGYEEIDDYLSFVNRTIRNLIVLQNQQTL